MPGVSGVTVVTTLVCSFYFACEAAGAASARHSLRPLFSESGIFLANLGRIRPRDREAAFGERDIDARIAVMPGLDPGIHQTSHKHFSKRMDCRVKPGNDGARMTAAV
jgi:hypothetical protein